MDGTVSADSTRLIDGVQRGKRKRKGRKRSSRKKARVPEEPPTPIVVPPAVEPPLCKEQRDLVELIVKGHNVFYTGSAGCGKSTVLKAFVRQLSENHGKRIKIIAPTGKAALDINGSTTWTFAGWTPDSHKKTLQDLRRGAHGKFVSKRLQNVDVLVIDEISMVENHHFERLNHVMQEARGNARAFGGVQIVVTGDFCQLPPVKPFAHCIQCGSETRTDSNTGTYTCPRHGCYLDVDKWAFRSEAWKECGFVHVNLKQIHRQSDALFISILQKLRIGVRLSPEDTQVLLEHPCKTNNAVQLFSTREEVRQVNRANFERLRSKAKAYCCHDYFQHNPAHGHLLNKDRRLPDGSLVALQDHRYEPRIELKQGMLVVLLANLDLTAGLVNGSQGVITGWQEHKDADLPTANKKRGDGEDDLKQTTLGGEYADLRVHELQLFIRSQVAASQFWPIVRFSNGVVRTILADCTVNELGDEKPYSLLARAQIPLTAAWAISIHKSQGMTLNTVIVDLKKSFEEGQAYVALSRARSLDGLKVQSLESSGASMGGNAQVKAFLHEKFPEDFPRL